jgi:hypothetical protein
MSGLWTLSGALSGHCPKAARDQNSFFQINGSDVLKTGGQPTLSGKKRALIWKIQGQRFRTSDFLSASPRSRFRSWEIALPPNYERANQRRSRGEEI